MCSAFAGVLLRRGKQEIGRDQRVESGDKTDAAKVYLQTKSARCQYL